MKEESEDREFSAEAPVEISAAIASLYWLEMPEHHVDALVGSESTPLTSRDVSNKD